MKRLTTFQSKRWGTVHVQQASYLEEDGPLAILLESADGEPLTTLSVNMYLPECSHDSRDLPADCFYVKLWGGNEDLSQEALASGLFIERGDLPQSRSGYVVSAPVWQLRGFAVSAALEKRRATTGKKAGAALEKAAEALRAYVAACRACGDELHLDDDRILTGERCDSLGECLNRAFGSTS